LYTGIGAHCGLVAGTLSIQEKFSHNRGLATGMLSVGNALGSMVHPFHTILLLDLYGLFGLLLIHGALSYQMVLYSFAYTSDVRQSPKTLDQETKLHKNGILSQPNGLSVVGTGTESRENTDINKYNETLYAGPRSNNGLPRTCNGAPPVDAQKRDNIPSNKRSQNGGLSFKSYCKEILDFSMLHNPSYILSILLILLLFMVRLGMQTHIVNAALLYNISSDKAAYLLSITSFGNLVGSISCSIVVNFRWMNYELFICFGAVLLSICAFLPAWNTSYTSLAVSASLLGIGDGK
jgi:hypothetical protein